jgi:hypothetical protein
LTSDDVTDYAVRFVPVSCQDFVFCNVICRGLVYVHSERNMSFLLQDYLFVKSSSMGCWQLDLL